MSILKKKQQNKKIIYSTATAIRLILRIRRKQRLATTVEIKTTNETKQNETKETREKKSSPQFFVVTEAIRHMTRQSNPIYG